MPVESSTPEASEKRSVTFSATDRLPKICLGCGAKQGVTRRPLRLRWIPLAAYLGLPFGVIPYLIVVSLAQEVADAQIPFCDACNRAWLNGTLYRGGVVVTGLVSAIVTLTVGLNGAPLIGVVLALASTATVTFAWRRLLPPTRLRLRRIAPGNIVFFEGVARAAAEAIEARRGRPRAP